MPIPQSGGTKTKIQLKILANGKYGWQMEPAQEVRVHLQVALHLLHQAALPVRLLPTHLLRAVAEHAGMRNTQREQPILLGN